MKMFLPMVLAATSAGSVLFAEDTVVKDDITDQALAIEVMSGNTVTYSGVISGTSSITKGGDGILILSNPANSFTGGINLQRGYVKATAAGALGADSNVIAFSGTLTHQLIIDVEGAAEFKNPITFTGKASNATYPAVKILGGPVTLSGNIESDTDFFVQYGSSGDDASANTVTLSGPVKIENGKLGIGSWAPFELKGKLDVPEVFVGFQGYGQNKTVQLWNADNKIGVISIYSGQVQAKADNAFGGAQIYLFQNWHGAESYSLFNLNGKKMKVSSFSHREGMGNKPQDNGDKGGLFLTYSATTVTVTGCEGEFTCLQKLSGPMSLVVDAKEHGESFVQRFIERGHTISGTISVSNGTMCVSDSTTFANVPTLIVGPNGKLLVEDTGKVPFPGCTKLILEGRLTVADDAVKPFSDGMLELVLGPDAELRLPDNMQLKIAKLEVGGEVKTTGGFGANELSQIKGGVLLLPVSGESVWTAGASPNESISEAGNWGETMPDILYGSASVFFGESGTNVNVDCAAQFDEVRVKAPESGKGYAFTSAAEGALLGVGGNVTFEKDAAHEAVTNVYAFNLPVRLNGESNWSVPANDILELNWGVVGAGVLSGFTKSGAGSMELLGASSVPGPYIIAEGNAKLSGSLGPAGTGEKSNALLFGVNAESLVFHNAVVDKDIFIENNGYASLKFQGATNVLNGYVARTDGARNFHIGKDTTLVFNGGAFVLQKWNICNGTVIFRNGPWVSKEWLCVGYDGTATRAVIETKGTCPRLWTRSGSVIDFRVSDANTNSAAYWSLDTWSGSYSAGGTFDLNSTTQTVCYVYGGQGCITGRPPACIAIDDPEGFATNLSAKVEGGVSFLKRGGGTFTLKGRDFTSCGDIVVEGGVLEIAADATWRNGTNVCVKGAGTLKLGASNRFSARHAQFHFGADSDGWSIDIPSGCSQTVDYAWDSEGNRLPCGVYGAAGVPGVTQTRYASHFAAAGGVIAVRMHGTVISFR